MKLRLLIDWKCNRSCSYCCNKIPEIRESFKYCTYSELQNMLFENQYQEIALTGGEPLLFPEKTLSVINLIKSVSPNSKIYLYTNGDYIYRFFAQSRIFFALGDIDGINIGIHTVPEYWEITYYTNLYRDFPELSIRILIQDTMKKEMKIHETRLSRFDIRYWNLNDCLDMEPEDRICLTQL